MSGTSQTTPWAAALEGLAEKRQHITDAIVSLAKVAGVDPAPYLDTPAFAVVDPAVPGGNRPLEPLRDPRATMNRLREAAAKVPTPPRPQRPAPPTTNGAGLEDRVLAALKNGPRAPRAIVKTTKIVDWKLAAVLRRLTESKKVRKSGTGPRNTQYQLA